MKHGLVTGTTQSGKTTYVIFLCYILKKLGFVIIWFTSIPDARLRELTPYVTHSKDELLKWFWTFRRCIVVFDEGTDTVGRFDKEIEKTATQGRHKHPTLPGGEHSCIYIGQAAQQINPTIRGQCAWTVAFLQGSASCEILVADFVCPGLRAAGSLGRFEYLRFERFGKLQPGKLTL